MGDLQPEGPPASATRMGVSFPVFGTAALGGPCRLYRFLESGRSSSRPSDCELPAVTTQEGALRTRSLSWRMYSASKSSQVSSSPMIRSGSRPRYERVGLPGNFLSVTLGSSERKPAVSRSPPGGPPACRGSKRRCRAACGSLLCRKKKPRSLLASIFHVTRHE